MITIRLGQQTLEGGSRAAAVTLWWMEEVAPTGYVFKKKIRDYLGIFPNMEGGVFPIPKTQNQKKVSLNHPKMTQKTN